MLIFLFTCSESEGNDSGPDEEVKGQEEVSAGEGVKGQEEVSGGEGVKGQEISGDEEIDIEKTLDNRSSDSD